MKKIASWFRTPAVTVLAFIAAFGLLAYSGIGIAQAVPEIQTENEYTQIAHNSIGVTLQEDGKGVSGNSLLQNMTQQTGGKLVLNHEYEEPLRVVNSGQINEYVRVTVRKYWLGADGKQTDLSPDLIKVKLGGSDIYSEEFTGANGWVKDPSAFSTTDERVMLYYTSLVNSGDPTEAFVDSIEIDNSLATEMKQEPSTDGKTITTIYKYDGVQFCLEATVDAVQEHNAQYVDANGNSVGAIKSAWGRNVTVSGNSLTLN